MTFSSATPFVYFFLFLSLLRALAHWFEPFYRRGLHPPPVALVRGAFADLTFSKAELIAENALLRQQLAILPRQGKRPHFHHRERFWLLVLASRVQNWKDALVIVKPGTLLRWHRAGFCLFWRWKSMANPKSIQRAPETIALIQQMAGENLTWGAERLRGELLQLDIHVAKRTIQQYVRGVRPFRSPSQTWRTFHPKRPAGFGRIMRMKCGAAIFCRSWICFCTRPSSFS